jgi:hypothetical protein
MYSVPQEITDYIRNLFSTCNDNLSSDLSTFPGMREETFDNNFISYFSRNQGPYKFDPNWTVRIDTHFMGGGRHYENGEAADIGLMVIFRKQGKILRSKLAFLQSKKLYGDNISVSETDKYHRMGMGKLLVTTSESYQKIPIPVNPTDPPN